MVQRKLSFDVDGGKIAAIATYVRKNVSSISFIGKMKGKVVESANIEIGTVELSPIDKLHWGIRGHIRLGHVEGDGTLEENFSFSGDCDLAKDEEGAPVVSNLAKILVGEKL